MSPMHTLHIRPPPPRFLPCPQELESKILTNREMTFLKDTKLMVAAKVRPKCVPLKGADPGQDATPEGGGYPPPLYRPQNGCTEQWVLWAPEILF